MALSGRDLKLEDVAEGSVERFVNRLTLLPASDWLLAARLAKDTAEQRAEPIRHLEDLITSQRLAVAAWLATDGVATAGYLAFPPCSANGPRALELTARRAAEVAAHALLVRERLSTNDFAVLYLPFMTLIPAELR
jgi:hypothetical protein